jgi:hypothetical protein
MTKKRSFLLIIIVLIFFVSACVSQTSFPMASKAVIPTETSIPARNTATEQTDPSLVKTTQGLTFQQADGNRVVPGKGNLPVVEPIRIELDREISWLVGSPFRNGVIWIAALEDGRVRGYLVQSGNFEEFDLNRSSLPLGAPPIILVQEDQVYLNTPPDFQASPLTHPVSPNPETGRIVFITNQGDLVLWEHGEVISQLAVAALPDARILQDENGRLLLLTDPTTNYDHGVLGDSTEASSITLLESHPELKVISKIVIPAPGVVEGIAPIWEDINGDGEREILVTESNFEEGARLVLYSEDGQVLARGPAAGQAYRWRHQLAAASLGEDGEMLIVDVLRPHLDATVEFFRWKDQRLVLVAEVSGFSSHGIGSRNLDQALVGDMNGDGTPELVVPDLTRQSINGIQLMDGNAEVIWTIPLGGGLTSNLAAVSTLGGELNLGAGVGSNLLVWE